MKDNITQRLRKGITIGFYTQIATQATTFLFGLILARLLQPEDYGLIGVLAIFLLIIDQLIDGGFGSALLQQKEVKLTDYNSVFIINIVMAALLYFIFYFCAPFIAEFYKDQRLISIVRAMGLVSVIKALGSTQGAYLNKCQHYAAQARVYYISLVSGMVVAVIFAFWGFSFWALIIKSLTTTILLAIGWWYISPWKPKIEISLISLKKLFSFGSKLLVSSLVENSFRNIYSLIIGKLFSLQALGYYNRAQNFYDLPDQLIRQSLFGKIYPVFSYYQDDNEKLKFYYKKLLIILAFVIYPIYSILFFMAYPLIEVLLTDKWIFAAPLLQILCLQSFLSPFESINGNILYVKGKSSYVLIVQIIRRSFFICVVFIAYRFGVKGLLWGLVLDSFVVTSLYYLFSKRLLRFSLLKQIMALKKVFLILLPSISIMLLISSLIDSNFLKLVFGIFIGSSTYLVLAYVFMQEQLIEVLKVLKLENSLNHLRIKKRESA